MSPTLVQGSEVVTVGEPVKVTRVQRDAARLRIMLADRRGETVSEAVRKIAEAKPRPTAEKPA